MARTKQETDELLLAVMEWAEADPDAALVVATVNDGTQETGALITLGHAGCSVVSTMATVAELLDLAEEQILAGKQVLAGNITGDDQKSLKRIRDGRAALGLGQSEAVH
ncbi:hypothetical protein [Methylobacterium sp. Leaf100]|uniref:hypothetical protein n=1 Tax=Methylobacterium sp. Leaf100 TaxID=1736252 RepID=UPI00070072CC|nr:hypothetical protein [Methylobacterium sp. Leaf100]KQP36674.1 hypothetical protein ASF25_01585 [Methylobacterium sp. Leaf100]